MASTAASVEKASLPSEEVTVFGSGRVTLHPHGLAPLRAARVTARVLPESWQDQLRRRRVQCGGTSRVQVPTNVLGDEPREIIRATGPRFGSQHGG
jgi:hypothetical protein